MQALSLWWSGHAAYFAAHPELFVMLAPIVWPILTGFASFLDERIAARWPAAAAVLATAGFDAKGLLRLGWNRLAKKVPIPPLPIILIAFSLLLAGCASTSPRDRVVNAANAAKEIGATAESMLAGADRTEQEQCLVTHDKAEADACIAAVRARYKPAWKAYRDYRLAWLAVAAGVHAYDAADALGKKPDPAAVATLANSLTDAAAKVEAAIAALQGGK